MDCGGPSVESASTAINRAACSSVAAGGVGNSMTTAPDMSAHQHGAWEPVPWDDGMAS